MRHVLSVLLTTAVLATVAVGCAPVVPPTPAPTTPAPTTPATAGTPSSTVSPAPATSTPVPAAPVTVKAYFAYHEKMQPAARALPAGTTAVLKGALEALLAGPTAAEKAAGLVTMVPAGTTLRDVTLSGHVAVVDFSAAFASGGGSLSMTDRLAQVVYTATQFPGVTSVTLKLDGKTIKVLGGEGIMVDHPRTRKSCEGETPAILIDRPAWGGTLKAGGSVGGTADVFEAVFQIQVRDSSGALVFHKTVHATSGTGTRGTWTVTPTLSGAKPGVGSIRVYESSAKDGSPVNIVKIPMSMEP
ncbi:MAG TPA: GerMN domain-containing protein [Coriobacteriia bacterium]